MSGTTILQQGLTTTCKDPRISLVESDGRSLVGRMSPYERRRRGNALPGRARRDPDRTVTPGVRQRGSGHLAVSGAVNWVTGSNRISETSVRGQPSLSGADASQRLNLISVGKACPGEPRSEPDSGNPTVRDRRGASGNVAMGAGLRGCEFLVICTAYADRLMNVSPGHSALSDVRHTKSRRTNDEKFTTSEAQNESPGRATGP